MKKTYNYNLGIWVDEIFQDERRIEKMQMIPTNQKELDAVPKKRTRKPASNKA